MEFRPDQRVGCRSETIRVPLREITDAEFHGRVRGAQPLRSNALYEGHSAGLVERVKRSGREQPVEVQVLRVGDLHLAGIPAEYFVEFQLKIKAVCRLKRACVVGGGGQTA